MSIPIKVRKASIEKIRGEEEEYENILLNIDPRSRLYQYFAGKVLSYIEKEELMRNNVDISINEIPRDIAIPVAGDTFNLFYSFFPLLKNRDDIRNEVLSKLRDAFEEKITSREYNAIRRVTKLNSDASLVFSSRFVYTFLSMLKDMLPPEAFSQQKAKGEEEENEGGGEGQDSSGSSGSNSIDQSKIGNAVSMAFSRAWEEASRAVEAYNELGGLGKGVEPGKLAFIDRRFPNTIEFNVTIKILGELRKRMPIMFKKHRETSKRGLPEGYRLTRNPIYALPREFALPEEVFLVKMARGFIGWEKKTEGKGVMILLLDKSGSMDGLKMGWAKAVALALAQRAVREKHDYLLIPFDSRTHSVLGVSDVEKIASIRADGGTNITNALVKAIDVARKKGYKTANIIVITDGIDSINERLEAVITTDMRRINASLKVFFIDGDNEALRRIAEKTGGDLYTVEPTGEDAVRVLHAA